MGSDAHPSVHGGLDSLAKFGSPTFRQGACRPGWGETDTVRGNQKVVALGTPGIATGGAMKRTGLATRGLGDTWTTSAICTFSSSMFLQKYVLVCFKRIRMLLSQFDKSSHFSGFLGLNDVEEAILGKQHSGFKLYSYKPQNNSNKGPQHTWYYHVYKTL